jgi:hypothetical protein
VKANQMLWLSIVSVATLGCYLLLAWRYPLGGGLATPRASWATMVAPTGWNAVLHLAIYLGLALLYGATLRLLTVLQGLSTSQRRWQYFVIVVTWLSCSFALMAAAPGGESHDIFDYTFRGRMMVEYHANPLVDVPADFSLSTPFARYVAWRKNVDTYGPLWEAASAAVALGVRLATRLLGWWGERTLSCPNSSESCRLLAAYISGYRLLAIAMTGVAGWLVARIVARNQPTLAPTALAAWLLCPMTLAASALGGHNDSVMVALLLLGWRWLQTQRPFLALLALILAAHVKLTALIWLPACALWILWRWGWRRALWVGLASALSGLAVSWLLYAPFGGWQSLQRMLFERWEYLANSLWRILKTLLINQWGWTVRRAHRLSVGWSSWLFVIGAVLIPLWFFNFRPKRWRRLEEAPPDFDLALWRALLAVSLWYLAVGAFWFQSWYVLWAVAPAALLPNSRFTRLILPWLVFGALSANFALDFMSATWLKTSLPMAGYILAVLMIWTPALVATAIQWGRVGGRRILPGS